MALGFAISAALWMALAIIGAMRLARVMGPS